MPRFLIPLTVKIEVEAETLAEATQRVYGWRKVMLEALRGRLPEVGIRKYSIPPVREVTEGDEAWFANEGLRPRFRKPWVYEERQVPIFPGARINLTHRVAVGPDPEQP